MTEPKKRSHRRRWIILAAVVILLGGATTTALLLINKQNRPGNDRFADAVTVVNGQFAGTTAGAQSDPDAVAAGLVKSGAATVWYRWTAPKGGWAYVTSAQAGGTLPGVQAFLGQTVAQLKRVDVVSNGSGGGAAIPAVAGRSYALLVDQAGDGSFDLSVAQPAAAAPPGDELGSAQDVGQAVELAASTGKSQTVAVDTLAQATTATGEPKNGSAAAAHSVWYSWPAHSTGRVSFAAQPVYGSTGPFRVAVYVATPPQDSTTGMTFADLHPTGAAGTFTAAADSVYVIAVDGPEEFYSLSVTASGILSSVDTTPPTVKCDPAPTAWSNAPEVSVQCTATDTGAGLAQPADASFGLTATAADEIEATNLSTGSRSVCDLAGNCTTAGPIDGLKADRKPPTVNCLPAPVTWQPAAPSISCTASDDGSGLATPADATRSFTAPAAQASGDVTIPGGQVCDAAGNCTTVGPFGPVLVDALPPVSTCDPPPSGPQHAQVVINCSLTDAGSGLAVPTDGQFTLQTSVGAGRNDKAAKTDSRNVCDLAGNCATIGPFGPFEVDLGGPSVVCSPPNGTDLDQWQAAAVTVSCSVSDSGPGLATGTSSEIDLTATLPVGQESDAVAATGTAGEQQVCDTTNVCVPVGPVTGVKIDRKAPVVACPTADGSWTAKTASFKCSVVDGGAGVAGPGFVTLTATQKDGVAGPVSTGTGNVCDAVGNCAAAGPITGLLVDAAPPTLTCASPAPVYHVEARIHCTAKDVGAGLVSPEEADFTLVTSVGDGNTDPTAQTNSQQICDRVGLCVTAGPVTVDVDLKSPPGDGPVINVPQRVTVLVADDGTTNAAVWYDLPTAAGADSVECRSAPGSAFPYGWSTVVCEAVAPLGVSYATFPVVVKSVPELAAGGQAVAGGSWRAVGIGFAPNSPITVTVDDASSSNETADQQGRLSSDVQLAADLPPGEHQLRLRGKDSDGNPILLESPLTVVAPPAGATASNAVPSEAPVLPANGVTVPVDPGPAPAAPDLDNRTWPTPTAEQSGAGFNGTATSSAPGASSGAAPTPGSPGAAAGPRATDSHSGGLILGLSVGLGVLSVGGVAFWIVRRRRSADTTPSGS